MSKIHIVFGPQGAGKSTYAQKLKKELNGVLFSIDDWMWKLYGEDMPQTMNLKWIMERVDRCEKMIWEISKNVSDGNNEIILDLGFTKRQKRQLFEKLAKDHSKEVQLHYIDAEHSIRRKRVLERNVNKGSTFSFEVTSGMFDFMEKEFHRITESEMKGAIVIDTN